VITSENYFVIPRWVAIISTGQSSTHKHTHTHTHTHTRSVVLGRIKTQLVVTLVALFNYLNFKQNALKSLNIHEYHILDISVETRFINIYEYSLFYALLHSHSEVLV